MRTLIWLCTREAAWWCCRGYGHRAPLSATILALPLGSDKVWGTKPAHRKDCDPSARCDGTFQLFAMGSQHGGIGVAVLCCWLGASCHGVLLLSRNSFGGCKCWQLSLLARDTTRGRSWARLWSEHCWSSVCPVSRCKRDGTSSGEPAAFLALWPHPCPAPAIPSLQEWPHGCRFWEEPPSWGGSPHSTLQPCSPHMGPCCLGILQLPPVPAASQVDAFIKAVAGAWRL